MTIFLSPYNTKKNDSIEAAPTFMARDTVQQGFYSEVNKLLILTK